MLNFLLGIVGNLIADELLAWSPNVARQIISAAARSLPDDMQERMFEEWGALLDDTKGNLSKLCVAASLYWRREKIAANCEDPTGPPVPSLLMDSLTATEDEVFALAAQGKSHSEIAALLRLSQTTVEYCKLTCVQKLSGQPNLGREDLVSFFAARPKDSRSAYRRFMIKLQRERSWRSNARVHDEVMHDWWRNSGGRPA